ncbi:MAG: family transcriptional regulator, cyclic receptor protein [Desulfovibrionales bacterium]|jgi:hypothetical protein|nr:family transcriptional regulator, cyclic receptor protein [Desulfovibrionales bacterium]
MANYLVKEFDKGAVIFREGDVGDAAYLLQKGRVEVSKQASGRSKVLAVLSPVSVFGEMAVLLPDLKRTATATALSRVKTVMINKKSFDSFVEQTPNVIQSILSVLVRRLKSSTERFIHSSSIYHGLVLTIDILRQHAIEDVDYMKLNKMLADAFSLDPKHSKTYIDKLDKLGLVKIWRNQDGVKKIRIYEQDHFVDHALKLLAEAKMLDEEIPVNEGISSI